MVRYYCDKCGKEVTKESAKRCELYVRNFKESEGAGMTDAEIIKALECCANNQGCNNCPLFTSDSCFVVEEKAIYDLINRQKNEIISRTEEYNDMLEQRNKVEETLEVMTMDVNSLTSERDALNEMVAEQKAELSKKDTKIDILIQKKNNAYDEIAELKAEVERLQREGLVLNNTFMDFVNMHKTEAIKEFAEKFKKKAGSIVTSCQGYEIYETKQYQISAINFDNLVKEMTEGR